MGALEPEMPTTILRVCFAIEICLKTPSYTTTDISIGILYLCRNVDGTQQKTDVSAVYCGSAAGRLGYFASSDLSLGMLR